MKQQAYLTDTEYIEAMMKRFKLVDMRKQYRDLVLEAESSCMGYEAFLKRLLSVEAVSYTHLFRHAATPRALERYVFPLPDAPMMMIWRLSRM